MTADRTIFYTAGCHGRFLAYLFDCHAQKQLLPRRFNDNGNSHGSIAANKNVDICHSGMDLLFQQNRKKNNDNQFCIVWDGLESFFYAMSCYTDRGARLRQSGIQLLETDLKKYEELYGVPVHITDFFKQHCNFDAAPQVQPPRGLLRNYFLTSMYKHFEHTLWTRNQILQKTSLRKIQLNDILDYKSLRKNLEGIFGYVLDFEHVHGEFLKRNTCFHQLQLVRQLLDDVKNHVIREIAELNVISEAYVLFYLDVEHFDVPLFLGNDFFKNTGDIIEYIKYFPNFMKTPNKLFHQYHSVYSRNT